VNKIRNGKLKKVLALGAAAVCAVTTVPFASCMEVQANENTGYTYNYDYWEEYQNSPDVYEVCNVFTSTDLGLETALRNPDGMFVKDDLIYVCDSGNNRIVVLERTSTETIEVREIYDTIGGDIEPNTLSNPTDNRCFGRGRVLHSRPGQCENPQARFCILTT